MATAALARMTFANALRQPMTWLVVGLGLVMVLLSMMFGVFNFLDTDRLRLLCTAGVAVAALHSLFLAVVGASQAVHDELSSRTALTLFAKPMSRHSFIIGKALGIWMNTVVAILVIMGGHYLALWIALENGPDLTDEMNQALSVAWVPWGRIAAGHVLVMAASLVMTALATVLALRFTLVINVLICFAVFVLAHLLGGLGQHGAVLVPALQIFNIDDSLQFRDQGLPWAYFALCLVYALLYSSGILSIGLAWFRRQDIP